MSLGERLTNARKEKNLSQEEVAEKLNVTRQTVSKWETDQSMPDFDKIVPLCTLFEMSFDELITGNKKESVQESIPASNNNVKGKRALGIGLGILLYFVAVVWIMISVPVMFLNPIVASGIFLLICGVATFIIVYVCILYKKEETKKEKEDKSLYKRIDGVLSLLFLIAYLGISFATSAWHITWIIWLVYALVAEIVKLILSIKGEDNEK